MIVKHLHTHSFLRFDSKKFCDFIPETVIIVDVILNEDEVFRFSNIPLETIEFRATVGKYLDLIVAVKMGMAKRMRQFDHLDLIVSQSGAFKRRLSGPRTFEKPTTYLPAHHCLTLKASPEKKIEDYADDRKKE